MDIHTPTTRHARMGDWHPGMCIPQRIVSPSIELVSTPPVISAPIITVDRAKGSERSSRSLLASMAANHSVASDATSVVSADSTSTSSTTTPRKSATLGRRVGGWVLGKWGVAPVSSDPNANEQPEEQPNEPTPTSASASTPQPILKPPPTQPQPDSNPFRFRFTGVNQKGPILGLKPPPSAPVSIHPQGIDENLLRESLADG
ncbi:hypothetical protein N7532_002384 [Penicillium argentinense]|uniref:Uncharacterized protein n=1 Tax=Penicillium argentinense TaxID=1131581 RepID=A0A9W9KK81_9EURO|nr:uncharacterized protein N7532_002384 [Penicillium argentinense]KAJ5109739.1 hypothetical protein N7532_002384 [Penicillium argentinense]